MEGVVGVSYLVSRVVRCRWDQKSGVSDDHLGPLCRAILYAAVAAP